MVRAAVAAIAVLAALVCIPGRAPASDNSDVIAVINDAVASFNKGDGKTWETLCTSPAYIICNIPPYQYSTTCADWWSAHATGNVLTVALQKTAAGWKMTGWAWAQH